MSGHHGQTESAVTLEGVLLKGYGGFYYVQVREDTWECSLRGRFRVKKQDFLPGDRVRILPGQIGKATIEEVLARTSELSRPPIANVEQVILVFPLTSPDPDTILLDRILVQAYAAHLSAAVIFTKQDLLPSDKLSDWPSCYRRLGIPTLAISNESGTQRAEVEALISGKISVLAGPSGAGKSSLINSLQPDLQRKTGDVSVKIKRGRHTTRHVELLSIAGGLVADTPGFSSLYLPLLERESLQDAFPEFSPYRGSCRFASCLHDQEPDCSVRAALQAGKIWPSRYEHYRTFLQEVKAQKKY